LLQINIATTDEQIQANEKATSRLDIQMREIADIRRQIGIKNERIET